MPTFMMVEDMMAAMDPIMTVANISQRWRVP
jgi:hypothetical protein